MDRSAPTAPAQASDGPAIRGRRWGVGGYVLLAYAISWAWLIPIALSHGLVSAGDGWPTHFPALLGPLIAALVLTAAQQGRPGLRDLFGRMTRVRVPVRWWLFALSPLLLLAVILVFQTVSGRPTSRAQDFAVFSGLPTGWGVLGVAGAILLVNGFGEETGWRGFALARLQRRHSPLVATLVVAAIWAGWHAPMFVVVDTFRSFGPAILVGWVIGLFSGAVVLGWLYNRSGGSILLVAVWHGTYNLISGTAAATGLLAATSTTSVIALAIALVSLEIRAGRRGSPSVLGPTVQDVVPV